MTAECDNVAKIDKKSRWQKVDAGLAKIESLADDIAKEGATHFKTTDDPHFLPLITKNCQNNAGIISNIETVMNLSAPCADKKRLAAIQKFAKVANCRCKFV